MAVVGRGIFFLISRAGIINDPGVKRFLHRLTWWSLSVALLSPPSARAQAVEGEFKGVKHAFLDPETGKRLMLLTSGSVTNISNEELLVRDGVRLQFFDDAGKTNLEVLTPLCIFNTRKKQVSSAEKLQGASPDGQFFLEGEGFAYAIGAAGLVVSNRVHAVIKKELLETASPPLSAPGAEPARPPPIQAVPGVDPRVHIFSDWMRYQTNLAVFRERVRVEDPQGKLSCGVLTVEFIGPGEGEDRRRIDRILAEEDVAIDSAELHATGQRAIYRQASDLVELSGNPSWRLGQYQGRAEELTVDRSSREFHAARAVEITLPPGSVGRSGFFLPENPVPTNRSPAKAEPAHVRADDFQFRPEPGNTNFNLALLRGAVTVRSGTGNLACEQMTIRSLALSNRTESIIAERSVVMEQGDRRVTGEQAVYSAAADTVEISGGPAWKMGQRDGTAGLLVFDLTNAVYRARGGVRMQLPAGSLGRSTWLFPTNRSNAGQASGPPARPGVPLAGESPAPEAGTAVPPKQGAATAGPSSKPVEISADEFEFVPAAPGTKTDTAIYRGGVRVQDADRMRLSCERLTANLLSGTNQVESVTAEREVEIEIHEPAAERRVRGERAVYSADRAEVVLTGGESVEIVFLEPALNGRARGTKAVYAGGPDLLELTGNPVLTTPYGHVWGDVLAVDRAHTTLSATGNWKMTLNPDKLKAESPKRTAPPPATP